MSVVLSYPEKQLQRYWRIMDAGVGGAQSLTEYQDELEVLAMRAVSPALRAMCLRSVGRFDHIGSTRRVAVAR